MIEFNLSRPNAFWYAALRKEFFRILRFGLVGVLATGVHMAISLTLGVYFGIMPQVSNAIAFVASFAVSFRGHHSFSFRSSRKHAVTLPRFFVAAGAGYLASALTLALLKSFGLDIGPSLFLSACAIPVVSYLISRFWVF